MPDLIEKANECFAKQDFEGAIKCFDELIEKKMLVDLSLGYINKGVALRQLKRYDEAVACFDIVLKDNPTQSQALQYKSQVLADQKKYKEAVVVIDKFLEGNPKSMDMHRLKINYLNVSKDHEKALEACEKALEIDSDNLTVRVEQLLAQVNLNTTQANLGSDMKASCDWFTKQDCKLSDYQKRILGTALQQVGTYLNGTSDKANAIPYYDKSIELYPTAVAWFNRGVSLNQLKKRKKALKSFEQAVSLDPKMTTCWSMIGMIHLMKKDYFKSMHAYEKLPKQTKASLYNWGVACFKVARRIDAKEKFEAALKMDPEFQHAKDALAMLMKVWKDSDKDVQEAAPPGDEPPTPAPSDKRKYEVLKYEDIVAKKNIPKDWDFCNKDKYLSKDEFERVFQMTRAKFEKLPKWKQNRAKKKVNLF